MQNTETLFRKGLRFLSKNAIVVLEEIGGIAVWLAKRLSSRIPLGFI